MSAHPSDHAILPRWPSWTPTVVSAPFDEILRRPWRDFILRISVLMLMFYATRTFELRMVLRITGAVMLFSDRLLYSRLLWLIMTTLMAITVLNEWYRADNHYWLITYWALVCSICAGFRARPGLALLRTNARLLIGLCFLFATIWKIIGWQYFDGHFFLFQFEFDGRFNFLAELLGQPSEVYNYNNKVFGRLLSQSEVDRGFAFAYPALVQWVALGFCWWTIFIEGLIAWSYLSPYPRWLHERRDWTLILFIFTTYLLAPVLGFGSVLIVMGLAQCERRKPWTRISFLLSIVVLHLGNTFTKLAVDKLVE